MNKLSFFKGFFSAIILVCAILLLNAFFGNDSTSTLKLISKINEVYAYMDKYAVEDYDREKITDGIFMGMVAMTGDRYADYISKANAEQYNDSMDGIIRGAVGVNIISSGEDGTYIVNIQEGSSAKEEGLEVGDVIVKVDGESVSLMSTSEIALKVRGEVGTFVEIEIYRERDNSTFTKKLERRVVQSISVKDEMLDNNIGYIKISDFDSNMFELFEESYNKLIDEGMERLIIDLRDNGGGLMSASLSLSDFFMPEGLITYTEDKNLKRKEHSSDDKYVDIPLVILVNGASASASELFSGALKDTERAKIIGTQTFGKALVQTSYTLTDGSVLKLTTAKYFTPNGTSIQGEGISPDYEVKLDYGDIPPQEKYLKMQKHEDDPQFDKAVEIVTGLDKYIP